MSPFSMRIHFVRPTLWNTATRTWYFSSSDASITISRYHLGFNSGVIVRMRPQPLLDIIQFLNQGSYIYARLKESEKWWVRSNWYPLWNFSQKTKVKIKIRLKSFDSFIKVEHGHQHVKAEEETLQVSNKYN